MLRLAIAERLKLTAAGFVLGLIAGSWLSRILSSLLWGVGALDVLTFSAVSLFPTAIGILACYFPAKKAATLDPLVALRCDGATHFVFVWSPETCYLQLEMRQGQDRPSLRIGAFSHLNRTSPDFVRKP